MMRRRHAAHRSTFVFFCVFGVFFSNCKIHLACDVSAQEQGASKALRPFSGAGQCAREGPQAHAQAVARWEQGRKCTSDAAAASHAGRAFCSSTGEAGRGAAPRTLQRHGRSQLLGAAVAATVAVSPPG